MFKTCWRHVVQHAICCVFRKDIPNHATSWDRCCSSPCRQSVRAQAIHSQCVYALPACLVWATRPQRVYALPAPLVQATCFQRVHDLPAPSEQQITQATRNSVLRLLICLRNSSTSKNILTKWEEKSNESMTSDNVCTYTPSSNMMLLSKSRLITSCSAMHVLYMILRAFAGVRNSSFRSTCLQQMALKIEEN